MSDDDAFPVEDDDPFIERPRPGRERSPAGRRDIIAALILPTCQGSDEEAAHRAVARADALLRVLGGRR